ncbi:MAG: VOC family protein [Elusimicrobia bacterium]|nr:VOC family protein [Candidatus Liberimonas magnetica]
MDRVTGFEIPAANLKRAVKFFKNVFDWKIKEVEDEYTHVETVPTDNEWMPKEKGAVNGSLYKKTSKDKGPLVVISVASIDKTFDKVKKAKGKIIVKKTGAGEWGYWAVIKDTESNLLELWEDK